LKTLIRLCPISGHDGDKQAKILISVLKDFEIVRKISYYIEDNHNSNDKLYHAISFFLQNEEIT